MKATTNSSTNSLVSNRASYIHNLFHDDNEFMSFQSYLRWMYVDYSNARHATVSCALTRHAYDIVVQLSLTSTLVLSYLYLFVGEVAYKVW
ncbi:unnamed protein product [Musa acuminata subsp. burmannicoides]